MRSRLLVVAASLGGGGAERVMITLLRHLDRERFEIHLALVDASGPYLSQVPADVCVHDLRARRARCPAGRSPDRRVRPGSCPAGVRPWRRAPPGGSARRIDCGAGSARSVARTAKSGRRCTTIWSNVAFPADAPNQLTFSDVTERRMSEGRLYLCSIKDAFSNRIVGCSIDFRMKSRLATRALHSAVARRGEGLEHLVRVRARVRVRTRVGVRDGVGVGL